jgi:ABC-2 type transport system permease protein
MARPATVGGRIRRNAHIVSSLLLTDLRARMEYRVDFVIQILYGMLFHVAALVFVAVILTRFGGIGDWTVGEVIFIVGIRLTAHGLYETLFGNIGWVPWFVRDGWFDRLLVRPADALIQVVAMSFHVNGLGDLVVGLIALAGGISRIHLSSPPLAALGIIVVILGSMLLEAGIVLMISSLSFWFVRTEMLFWWFDDWGNTFSNYPVTVFPIVARFLLTWVVPLALLGFFPAAAIMGRAHDVPFTPILAWGAPVAGLLVFLLGLRVWRAGIDHHRSTGT